MNKKKIISSLTMAGLLATTVAGASVQAADTDPETKALGEYSKLITGKVAVPFILNTTEDTVTGKDMKISFPGKTITVADDTVLKTGDVVNINGQPRTIVIYGDTNCDGKVNIMDAVTTLNHVKGKAELIGAAFAAADLNNNRSLNILEAVNVLNVVKGKTEASKIATAPASETPDSSVAKLLNTEITEKNTIKLTFDADAKKGYTYKLYNDTDKSDVTIAKSYAKEFKEVTLTTAATTLDATKDYTLTVTKGDVKVAEQKIKYAEMPAATATITGKYTDIVSENMNSLAMKVEIANNAKLDEAVAVTVTLSDGKRDVKGTATLAAYETIVTVNNFANVSDLDDKFGTKDNDKITVKVELKDKYGNVKESDCTSVLKNTKTLTLLDAVATRNNTNAMTLTPALQDNKASILAGQTTKFIIREANDTTKVTADDISKNGTEYSVDTSKDYMSNLKDSKGNSLDSDKAYKVYVLVENANGVKSNVVETILASMNAQSLKATTHATLVASEDGVFEWKDEDNKAGDVKNYKVILYRYTPALDPQNDKYDAVAVKTVATSTDKMKSVNFFNEIKAEMNRLLDEKEAIGTEVQFKIGVTAMAASTEKKEIEEVKSEGIYKAQALPTIATTGDTKMSISVNENTNKQELNWTYSDKGVDSFKVNIYKYDEDGKLSAKPVNEGLGTPYKTDRKYNLSDALAKYGNGKYAITMVAVAPSDAKYVNSVESDYIYTYNFDVKDNLSLELKDNNKVTATMKKADGILDADKNKISYVVYKAIKNISGETKHQEVSGAMTANGDYEFTKDITLAENETYEMYVKVMYTPTSGDAYEIARTDIKPITTSKAAQKIDQALTKVDLEKVDSISDLAEAERGYKIGIKNNKILISDNAGNVTTFDDKSSNFSRIKEVVEAIEVGDQIQTIADSDDGVIVTVPANATRNHTYNLTGKDDKLIVRDESAIINGELNKVEVLADNVTINAKVNNKEDGVKVTADGKSITVSNGTKVTYKVSAGAADANRYITVNGIKLTGANGQEIVVTAVSKDEIKVEGSTSALDVESIDTNVNKTVTFDEKAQVGNTTFTAPTGRTLYVATTDKSSLTGTITVKADTNKLGTIDLTSVTRFSDNTITPVNNPTFVLGKANNGIKVANSYTVKDITNTVTLKMNSGTLTVDDGSASIEFNANIANTTDSKTINSNSNIVLGSVNIVTDGDGSAKYTIKDKKATVEVTNTKVTFANATSMTLADTKSVTLHGKATINGVTVTTTEDTVVTNTAGVLTMTLADTKSVTLNGKAKINDVTVTTHEDTVVTNTSGVLTMTLADTKSVTLNGKATINDVTVTTTEDTVVTNTSGVLTMTLADTKSVTLNGKATINDVTVTTTEATEITGVTGGVKLTSNEVKYTVKGTATVAKKADGITVSGNNVTVAYSDGAANATVEEGKTALGDATVSDGIATTSIATENGTVTFTKV